MTDRLKPLVASLALVAAILVPPVPADEGWVTLFDGKTTAGWVQHGGKAAYSIEEGALVGRTVLDTPNSFLCPPKEYADFVLEFEVWVDPKLNSGVQVRSASRPDYRNGVVHGYQIEIDPSERAWSGGIYDEQRRGWLVNPKDDPAARKAFKVGEWNRYRVEAAGDRLRTWVNDVPVADLVDGIARSGFIGFQVHQAKEAGLAVKWRSIRLKELAPVKRGSPRTRSPKPSGPRAGSCSGTAARPGAGAAPRARSSPRGAGRSGTACCPSWKRAGPSRAPAATSSRWRPTPPST